MKQKRGFLKIPFPQGFTHSSFRLLTQQKVQRDHLFHSIQDSSLPGLLAIELSSTGFAAPTDRTARLSRATSADSGGEGPGERIIKHLFIEPFQGQNYKHSISSRPCVKSCKQYFILFTEIFLQN